MKQKELTKTFIYLFQIEKPFGFHGLSESISALQGLMCAASRRRHPRSILTLSVRVATLESEL